MNKLKNESLPSIILIAVNVFVILIIIAGKYLFEFLSSIGNLFLILGGYIIIAVLLYQINRFWKNKAFKTFYNIFLFPLTFLYLFVAIAVPVLGTQIFLYLFLLLSLAIPSVLSRLDEYFQITSLKEETWIYIILTAGSIIATLFDRQVKKLTFKILPFTTRESEKMKRFRLVEICNYITLKNNVRLLIYSLFLLSLVVFNILNLQSDSYFENKNIDRAVLQFFITFIAFERVISNIRLSDFKPSKLLDLYTSSFKDEIKNMQGKE